MALGNVLPSSAQVTLIVGAGPEAIAWLRTGEHLLYAGAEPKAAGPLPTRVGRLMGLTATVYLG
jgi:hypothetical protein